MFVPHPAVLLKQYGNRTPEQLAILLGYRIERQIKMPVLPGVTVYSEYRADNTIILYQPALQQLAKTQQQTMTFLEQRHIAHELYHALAEKEGASPWQVQEPAADMWADEMLVLTGIMPERKVYEG